MSDSETDSNEPEVVSTPGKADGDAQAALRLGDSDQEIPVVLGGDVPDDVRETLEASVPDDAPFSIATAGGKAGEETASVPVAGGVDWAMDSAEFQGAGVSDFDRIRDERIQRIRQASVDYDHRIANWIFTKDDLVPGIAERMKSLIVGESGLQVKPADSDSEADQNFADWLTDEKFGEDVRPNEVVAVALRENMKHARGVLRTTDLRRLEIQDLTHVRDGLTGDEVYIQDAQSVATLDEDAIDEDGEMVSGTSTVVDYEDVDRRVLKLGEQVFHIQLYRNPPLEAVADDVVNKLVLKRLKARRAEIASIGGIYIKVEPPAGLPEEEYHAKEEVDWSDEPVTKLEKAMKEGIDDAFDTLSDYKAGSIMAIPENWTVESVELPNDDVPLDEQIRGYNKAIANRLLFPLDLFELKEGAELSRDTIFKTLITTIEGWRQEFVRIFEQFADVQKEIYDIQGDVEFEFPPLGAEDEEILVKLLGQAGAAGMSRSEVRQLMNRVEGVDLEIEPERPAPDPSTEPGGPSGQERQRSMEDALERQGDGDSGDDPGDGPRQVDTSGDAGRVLDDDALGADWDPMEHPRGPDGEFTSVPGADIMKKVDDVQSWLRDRYPENDVVIHEKDDQIKLEKVVIPEERRGEGVGTRFMNDLTGYADAKEKTVSLEPSTDFGASSRDRLIQFYKQFGFVENQGANKDFEISESMYRLPDGGGWAEASRQADVVQGSVGIPGEPLFANVPGVDDPETGFKPGEPDGWDRSSVVDAWTSLGGSFTTCVAEMTGDVRSPEAFCAALKDEFLGTENWRKGSASASAVIQASTTYDYDVSDDGSAEAESKTSFQVQFDGDLDAAAAMLQDVLESNGEESSIVQEGDDYRVIDFGPDGSDSTQVVLSETGDGEYVVAGRGRDASLFDGLEERVDAARSAPKVQAATFKLEKDATSLRDAASQVRRMVEDRVPDGYTADTKRKGDDQFVVFVRDEQGNFAGSLVLSEGVDGGYVVVGTSNFFDVDRPPVGRRDLTRVEGSGDRDGFFRRLLGGSD